MGRVHARGEHCSRDRKAEAAPGQLEQFCWRTPQQSGGYSRQVLLENVLWYHLDSQLYFCLTGCTILWKCYWEEFDDCSCTT